MDENENITEVDKSEIEDAVADCLDWLENDVDTYTTAEEFKEKRDEVEDRVSSILQAYRGSGGGGGYADDEFDSTEL